MNEGLMMKRRKEGRDEEWIEEKEVRKGVRKEGQLDRRKERKLAWKEGSKNH